MYTFVTCIYIAFLLSYVQFELHLQQVELLTCHIKFELNLAAWTLDIDCPVVGLAAYSVIATNYLVSSKTTC